MHKSNVLICTRIPENVMEYLTTFCRCENFDFKSLHRKDLLMMMKN